MQYYVTFVVTVYREFFGEPSSSPHEHCRKVWVALTIFWSPQLHSFCVRVTQEVYKVLIIQFRV